jgi:hypothetical protein
MTTPVDPSSVSSPAPQITPEEKDAVQAHVQAILTESRRSLRYYKIGLIVCLAVGLPAIVASKFIGVSVSSAMLAVLALTGVNHAIWYARDRIVARRAAPLFRCASCGHPLHPRPDVLGRTTEDMHSVMDGICPKCFTPLLESNSVPIDAGGANRIGGAS